MIGLLQGSDAQIKIICKKRKNCNYKKKGAKKIGYDCSELVSETSEADIQRAVRRTSGMVHVSKSTDVNSPSKREY